MNARMPAESADTVSLICALLVRFPEIASMRAMPERGTARFSFAVRKRLDRQTQRAAIGEIEDYVGAFLALAGDEPAVLEVECESDRAATFVHVTRDVDTLSRDELAMLVSLVEQRFADALVRNPVPDEQPDEDAGAQDELVEVAIEALRNPAQSKTLVGFREEKRVLVYFLKTQKKAKASARR